MTKNIPNMAMKKDFATDSWGIFLLKAVASLCPLIVHQRAVHMTPKVEVLIPPPVPPGDAPTNMSRMNRKRVGWVRVAISTVLKPAVRVVTAWKREARILCGMDSALMELVDKGWVSGYEAYLQADNKSKFERVKDDK